MRKIIYSLLVLFFLSINAQETILLSVDNDHISLNDFMKTYHKNRLDTDTLSFKDSLEEYLRLYINFKLKVVDAKKQGLDTLPSFIRELEGYKRQLIKPYLTSQEITEQLLEEAYERLKYEVSVSHILIEIDSGDTLSAYNKMLDIRQQLMNGADFIDLAQKFSNDPSVTDNNGDLGYFTALYMVYPFETAAYTTRVGEISLPVKTRFGYHLVRVNDKRMSRGEVKVAHIMLRLDKSNEASLKTQKDKIYEIYDSLLAESGSNFSELATSYSDDKKSGSNGGELEWFGSNKMVKSFEEASFSLDSIGSFSKPFETEFGWHIVKLLDKKSLPSFDEIKPSLTKKIERDSRSQKTRNSVINRLIGEWDIIDVHNSRKLFYKIINQDFFDGKDITQDINNNGDVLFVFNNNYNISERYVYQKDFANYLMQYRSRVPIDVDVETVIAELYKTFKEQKILEVETKNLEFKYDDFRLLVNEYHDGILLFNLSEKVVWNKAVQDSLGLQEFYQKNKRQYLWKDRISASIYSSKDEKIHNKMYKNLKRGMSKEDLLNKFNKTSNLNLIIEEGVFEKGDNTIIDQYIFSEDNYMALLKNDIIICGEQNKLILVKDMIESSVKDLDDIKGIVISDYQSLLEEEWLKKLKLNYSVVLNDSLFDIAKKNPDNLANDTNSKIIHPCEEFSNCFKYYGDILGYSSDVYFGWNNKIYTTEIKPFNVND